MTLITFSTAWLIGIAAARYVNLPLELIGLLTVLPLAALLLWRDDSKVRQIAACGLFLLVGSARYTLSLPDLSDPGHIAKVQELHPDTDRGEITLWGRVIREPHVRGTCTSLRLAVDQVRIEKEHLVEGRDLARAKRYLAYPYGDGLEVDGVLETPPVPLFSPQESRILVGLLCSQHILIPSVINGLEYPNSRGHGPFP